MMAMYVFLSAPDHHYLTTNSANRFSTPGMPPKIPKSNARRQKRSLRPRQKLMLKKRQIRNPKLNA
jgi:hypothetical protein